MRHRQKCNMLMDLSMEESCSTGPKLLDKRRGTNEFQLFNSVENMNGAGSRSAISKTEVDRIHSTVNVFNL